MTSYDVYSGDTSTLAVKINSSQTTGIKIAAMTINDTTTAWANQSGGVIQIVENVDGVLKREYIYYTGGTQNADSSFTLSGVVRGISRTTTDLSSGTGQSFNKGATVRFSNFHYIFNQKADVDRANTFSAAQVFSSTLTMSGSVKLYFNDVNSYIYDDGTDLIFKDSNNAERTLSALSALSGSNDKVAISANDTTPDYIINKITGGDGITVTETDDAGDETLDIDIDLATDPGLEFSTSQLRVKVKASGGVTRDADGLSLTTGFFDNEIFGDGSDGALNVTSGTTTIDLASANVKVLDYTSFTIAGGTTLDFSNPASDGSIVIFRVQGNVDINGTIDGSAGGADGGSAPTPITRTTNGSTTAMGNDGTNSFNSLGLTKNATAADGATPANRAEAPGGGGGANANAGSSSAATTNVSASAGGAAITAIKLALAQFGISLAPGAGGASGCGAILCTAVTGGTFTSTPGAGGKGGLTIIFIVGGDYDDTSGTINTSGVAGSVSTTGTGTGTQYAIAASAGGGGAAGDVCVMCKGTITQAGTHTLTGGAGGTSAAAVSVGGDTGEISNGAAGATGTFLAVPFIFGV